MVRAARMPGTAQAKLDSSGMNERPERPTLPISRSSRNAARGRYPESSSTRMNAKSSTICGRNTSTLPAPARTPSTRRLSNGPGGSAAPMPPASAAISALIACMNGWAQANTAWNMRNIVAARISGPATGWRTTRSIRSLGVSDGTPSRPSLPRMHSTSCWSAATDAMSAATAAASSVDTLRAGALDPSPGTGSSVACCRSR